MDSTLRPEPRSQPQVLPCPHLPSLHQSINQSITKTCQLCRIHPLLCAFPAKVQSITISHARASILLSGVFLKFTSDDAPSPFRGTRSSQTLFHSLEYGVGSPWRQTPTSPHCRLSAIPLLDLTFLMSEHTFLSVPEPLHTMCPLPGSSSS